MYKVIYVNSIFSSLLILFAHAVEANDLDLSPRMVDFLVKSTNSPSHACGPLTIQTYYFLRKINDPRANELNPIAPLCAFEPLQEHLLSGDADLPLRSDRIELFVADVQKFHGESMAITSRRFINEVVLPLRKVLEKNMNNDIGKIVAVDNAISYTTAKNFPTVFNIFLQKLKYEYEKIAHSSATRGRNQ